MSQTVAPAQHLHLDIELDPRKQFHYRIRGRDGHHVVLHRGDTITFTCDESLSIRFVKESPFEEAAPRPHQEALLHSGESFITARVRDNAPAGHYPYVVEVTKGGRVFTETPEIIVESA